MKIIKFSAKRCKPCLDYAPIFHSVKEKLPEHEFSSIDIEEQDVSMYNIRALPTTAIIKGDEIVYKKGLMMENDLINFINENVPYNSCLD